MDVFGALEQGARWLRELGRAEGAELGAASPVRGGSEPCCVLSSRPEPAGWHHAAAPCRSSVP